MQATAIGAIIPKARGMFAKRIAPAEYEELMRRRSVPELAALLKRHPYFGQSLATLSTTDPHRGQIEELLGRDIFYKYRALVHYDYLKTGVSRYFLMECEVAEVLRALHLLSIGRPGVYFSQIPAHLAGHTQVDLFMLGQARSFYEVAELLGRFPLYRPLRARLQDDPGLRDFPMTEAVLLRAYYAECFHMIAKGLSGRDARATEALFRQEAEVYNLGLIARIKTYFPTVYTPQDIQRLSLPYSYHLSGRMLAQMAQAKDAQALLVILRRANLYYTADATTDGLASAGGRMIYRFAKRMLHLTASPVAALAAFLSLAKLERQNVVNVVEGVRYGLEPEQIKMLQVY